MPYILRHTRKYRSPLARAMAGGAFTLIVVLLAWLWLPEKPERVRNPLPGMTLAYSSAAVTQVLAPDASSANKSKPFRLVYRNSVIPGGVHSAAELAAAMQADALVKAHYANFNVAAAQIVQAKQSRLVHVSYRTWSCWCSFTTPGPRAGR